MHIDAKQIELRFILLKMNGCLLMRVICSDCSVRVSFFVSLARCLSLLSLKRIIERVIESKSHRHNVEPETCSYKQTVFI